MVPTNHVYVLGQTIYIRDDSTLQQIYVNKLRYLMWKDRFETSREILKLRAILM